MAAAEREKKNLQRGSREGKFHDTGKLISKERSKYLRHKFQQVVLEALLKKGEEEKDLDESGETNGKPLVIPKKIDAALNLSRTNLKEFPIDLLDRLQPVQYLYLEENKLVELPQNFFQKLPSLKWLDLRNNSLTCLPTLGLSNHSSLEVVLLQGNRIRNLPIELAMVPSLKGLQTTGNPLTNVPYDCIAEGFSGVIRHLKKLCLQDHILVPVSDTVLVKQTASHDEMSNEKAAGTASNSTDSEAKVWDLDRLSQWRQFMKKKSNNSGPDMNNPCSTSEKRVLKKPKVSVTVRSHVRASFRPMPFRCGTYSRNKHKPTSNARNLRKTRLGYKRKPITMHMIEERARKDAHAAQIRETLEKQARKIQRMRDKEVLKSWRDHARISRDQIKLLDNYQQYPTKDFANKTPFDVDEEFLNMLNRVDLYRSLKEYDNRLRKAKKPKMRITALDLERQMNEIIQKLRNLDTCDPEEVNSPRAKEVHVCRKMSKILDIQKTLKQLQNLNSSVPGITPLGLTKSRAG